VRAALEAEYGPGVYRADGSLDRARVARTVFEDREARRRLDALVHPKLVAALREEIAAALRDPRVPLVLVDAALMIDWGLDRECDLVVAVVAPEPEQIARLVRARGWSPAHARQRLDVQRTNEQFADRADVVVVNDAGLDALKTRAGALFDEWTGADRIKHADRR
jgi:dephospho-CoA kinase